MVEDICKECQCRTCFLRIPDGGLNDCRHCDCCLEIAADVKTDCNKYEPINNFGGNK